MTFTRLNTEGHISLNGYEYDNNYDRIIDNDVFEEARHYGGEMFVENMKDDLYEGFEPICKGDDGNIYTVAFWGDRPVMWQRLKKAESENEEGEKNIATKTIDEMTYSEMKELLGLDDIDRSAYNSYREQLINDLTDAQFSGTDDPRIQAIMDAVTTYKGAYDVAYELVDERTYHEVYVELPHDPIVYDYCGIDAPIEAARIEFAHNILDGMSAPYDELLNCFKDE